MCVNKVPRRTAGDKRGRRLVRPRRRRMKKIRKGPAVMCSDILTVFIVLTDGKFVLAEKTHHGQFAISIADRYEGNMEVLR